MGKTFILSSSHFCTSVPSPNFLCCQLLPLFPLKHHRATRGDLSCIFVLCCLTCSSSDSLERVSEAEQQLSAKAHTWETSGFYRDCWAPWQSHVSPGSQWLAGTPKVLWECFSDPGWLPNRLPVTVTLSAISPWSTKPPQTSCCRKQYLFFCSFCEDRANLTPL